MTNINSIFFVELPAGHELALQFMRSYPDFDAAIPLPFVPAVPKLADGCDCENHDGQHNRDACDCGEKASKHSVACTCGHEQPVESALTRDMIIAGLLYVFAYDRDNSHFEYYKALFLAVEHNAKKELISIALFDIENFEFEAALNLLLALEGLFPNDVRIMLNLALFYDKRAEFYRQSDLIADAAENERNAEEYYRAAILSEPPLPEVYFNAAYFYFNQRNYAKARSLFNSYINLETKNDVATKEKKEKALDLIENINTQKLDDVAYADAVAFIKQDENEKALSRIRDFLAENPKVWNGWFVLGWALRKLERYADAEKAFLSALEHGEGDEASGIDEAYSDICNELAICYLNLKEFEKAKDRLLSAFELDTENIKIISNLGMVYYAEGDAETAKGFFNAVLTINENDALARYMIEKIDNANGLS